MKRNKEAIIIALLFCVPLSIVMYTHSDEVIWKRILYAILSGPFLIFESIIAAVIVSLIMALSARLISKLEAFKIDDGFDFTKFITECFAGAFGVIFVVWYYFTITNQHLFLRVYGGW